MNEQKNIKKINRFIILVAATVLILWLINFIILIKWEPNDRGTFGDMFGGINALFSGFAFIGVIYAIILQKEELEETRRELLGQKLELEASNRHREHQNFENTFFQMLEVQQSIINNMDINKNVSGATLLSGRDCFRHFVNLFNNTFNNQIYKNSNAKHITHYEAHYKAWRSDLGHYFRVMYNLVKLVDRSDVHDKKFYTNIIRAQMSDYEVAILFLNYLSVHGKVKFKPLAEKYSLLKMMDTELIHNSEELKSSYSDKAFS